MKIEEFNILVQSMVEEEQITMSSKGKEYTQGQEDRLSNFKSTAKELGLTPMQIWAVYFKKHIESILSYAKSGESFSNEPIQSRIMDARVYLALGRALIEDDKKK